SSAGPALLSGPHAALGRVSTLYGALSGGGETDQETNVRTLIGKIGAALPPTGSWGCITAGALPGSPDLATEFIECGSPLQGWSGKARGSADYEAIDKIAELWRDKVLARYRSLKAADKTD